MDPERVSCSVCFEPFWTVFPDRKFLQKSQLLCLECVFQNLVSNANWDQSKEIIQVVEPIAIEWMIEARGQNGGEQYYAAKSHAYNEILKQDTGVPYDEEVRDALAGILVCGIILEKPEKVQPKNWDDPHSLN